MELSDLSSGKQLRYSSSTSGSHHEVGEGSSMISSNSNTDNDLREHMFDKVVTPSDVGKLNRLVIPKQHAEKYFPLDSSSNEKGLLLNFEDKGGKSWRFRYSYWNSSQSYVMTKGWSRFVKDKKLNAGDIVSFQRGRRLEGRRLEDVQLVPLGNKEEGSYYYKYYIDWRRRMPPPPDQYYYHSNILDPNHHHQQHYQPSSMLQFQHGGSTATWFGSAPPYFHQHVLRPQYHHLPLSNCFTRDHNPPHLSQMQMQMQLQMMTATTTTSTSTSTSNLYTAAPFSSYSYNTGNQQYYHHHRQNENYHVSSTNPMAVHHGSVVYVGPIAEMQTQTRLVDQDPPRHHHHHNHPHLEGTSTSISQPMVFESLPVVQCGNKAHKRLRLFGVNMDCPTTADEDEDEDQEEDEDQDDDEDDHAAENYDHYLPDHHQHHIPHHYDLMMNSQSGQYDGAFTHTNNTNETPSIGIVRSANDSNLDKGKSSIS